MKNELSLSCYCANPWGIGEEYPIFTVLRDVYDPLYTKSETIKEGSFYKKASKQRLLEVLICHFLSSDGSFERLLIENFK